MEQVAFDLADNLNTPIMITNSEEKVIYKNYCAKKCIKSPRLGASITKYISKKSRVCSTPSGVIKILSIVNNGCVHRRAFVALVYQKNKPYYVWVFGSSLQLPEPEDLDSFDLVKLEKCLTSALDSLRALGFHANKSSIDRYTKIATPFFEAMRYLKYTDDKMEKFRAHKILSSLMDKTEELARLHNVRVEFNIDAVNPDNYYHLPFRSFTTLYMQALLTMLKISSYAPTTVTCDQQAEFFNMKIKSPIKPLKNIQQSGSMLFEIAAAYPDEYFNIVFLEQFAAIKEYKIKYNITEKNEKLFLELSFTTNLSEKALQVQDENTFVSNLFFNTLEQRIYEYMDTIFEIVK